MADKSGRDENQSAWEGDIESPKTSDEGSSTTYRLANPGGRAASGPVTRVPAVEPLGPRRIASRDQAGWLVMMGYNLLIFITSVCVMTLELTASRIIGKHLGASLYTWTSVIGVILAGITLGNWLGGYLSDRFDRHKTLGWMYLASSIFSAGVLFLEQMIHVLERPSTVSWPFWVLTVVALLFLLPAVAMGATSPLIASLALSRSNRLGATVGNVYAWGACGSIAGTFLTGFYLVDYLGSRSIIALVSGTLALLAAIMAGQQRVFRTAVLLGWMQFFLFAWIAASASALSWGASADHAAQWFNRLGSEDAEARRTKWYEFGSNVGQKLHELGLVLGLRDDYPGRYIDESQYSYIQISDARQQGTPVKVLRLDKLIHSYYDPAEPTALHYDYEKIYAAVTKVAAASRTEESAVTIPDFPGWADIRAKLPSDVFFDETSRRLSAEHVNPRLVQELLDLAPDSDYWFAVDQLSITTTQPNWGGLEAHSLDRLPDGVEIPAELNSAIRFDPQLRLLNAYQPITPEMRDRLIQLSPRGPWFTAVHNLRQQSGKISSFFIGGGGYIFPRWVAHEYPGSARIDVAELDPAVRDAVRAEMGMTPDDETRINTTVGDARQVIDDLLRENRQRAARNEPAVTYDFIYGDAFNDFSVPWHLTTREFQEKLRDLLSPEGVVQFNLIDIYPRTEFPGRPAAQAEIVYHNFLPPGLLKQGDHPSNQFVPAVPRFGKIEVNQLAAGQFKLRASEVLSDFQRKILLDLDRSHEPWGKAVHALVNATRQSAPIEGDVPNVLIPKQITPRVWTMSEGPFPALELEQTETGKYVLGYRGVMPDKIRDDLIALAADDAGWRTAITEMQTRSRRQQPGRFLGRFAYTSSLVFPNLYLFGTSSHQASVTRDTFVIVCSQKPLNLDRLDQTGYWSWKPFAAVETTGENERKMSGQMESVLAMAGGRELTDDFSPVENLLLPIFADQ